MKYHTTTGNIITSLILLLVVLISVVVFNALSQLPNYADRVTENILSRLSGDGEYTVSVSSVEPTLFNGIVLHNPSLKHHQSQELATARSISIDVPVYRFIWEPFVPKNINVTIVGLSSKLNQSQIQQFTDYFASNSQELNPDQTSSLLANRSIELQITDASIGYVSEIINAEVKELQASVLIKNAMLTQGSLSAKHTIISMNALQTEVQDMYMTLGTTVEGELGIRVDSGYSSVLVSGNINVESSFENWGISLVSESFDSLLGGSGRVGVTIDTLQAQSNFEAATASLQMATAGADITVSEGLMETLAATIPSLNGMYGALDGVITDISVEAAYEENQNLRVRFASQDEIQIRNQQELLLTIISPVFLFQQNNPNLSLQFDAEEIFANQIAHWDFVLPLNENTSYVESAQFIQPYALMIQDTTTDESNLEASTQITLTSTIPLAKTLRGFASGAVTFNSSYEITGSQLYVDDFTSDELEGEVSARILYRPESPTIPMISAELSHSQGMQLSFSYDDQEDIARLLLRMNRLKPYNLSPIFSEFFPSVLELLVPETTLQGNVSLSITPDLSLGRISSELGISYLAVNEQRFNVASTLSGDFDADAYTVELATVTTEGYRLSYNGAIDRNRLFPEGKLQLNEVESGSTVVAADFERLAAQQYSFLITSPIFPSSQFAGDVAWDRTGELLANGVLSVPEAAYPVGLKFDNSLGLITLESDNVDASVDILSTPGHITFDLNLNSLLLPPAKGTIFSGQGMLNGQLAADFSIAEELFLISAPQLSLTGLSWGSQEPFSFSFVLDADPRQLQVSQVTYTDSFGTLEGSIRVKNENLISLFNGELRNFSAISEFSSETGERLYFSFFPDERDAQRAKGSAGFENLSVSRFLSNIPQLSLNFSLVGEFNLRDSALGHATISGQWLKEDRDFSAQLHAEDWGLLIDEGAFRDGGTSISIDELKIPYTGVSELTTHFTSEFPVIWRDGTTRATMYATTQFLPSTNLFSWITNNFNESSQLPIISLTHSDVLLYGEIPWKSGTHIVSFADDSIFVESGNDGTVSGHYSFKTGEVRAKFTQGFPIPMDLEGTIHDSYISLNIPFVEFDIRLINSILLEPIIDFQEGLFTGSLVIDGDIRDPDYYGTLTANSVNMTTFWTVGELLSMKNPVVIISENLVTVAPTPISTVHTSGRRANGMVQLEASFEQWNIPHYRIDVLEIDNPISLWIPILDIEINVEALAAGTFTIDGTPTEETLYGDVTVSEGLISFGLPELPAWVVPKARTNIDMTLRTGRNVSFIFPDMESPILRATFTDNQVVEVLVEAPVMTTSFTGELAFRSGEIYYVQKNFYITEGSLKFPNLSASLGEDLMPRLNLRARLREFEADGTRVDIFMVLQEARFDDLNPRFESVPLRSTNEILELLGQNIVSAGSAQDGGVTSVAQIASAATDVISRLGFLQATTISLGFSSIIRESLGLDVFTIRTNLLQNIIFEALPGISGDTTISPIARYLDNTTMYIGKYLLDDFYLQGMLHFRRDSLGEATSFLANDLRIDTELSIEWSNPLATFSVFTQPIELSIFDLFDTMGFSVTKRFEF